MSSWRDTTCGQVSAADVGQTVTVPGWAHRGATTAA